MKYKYEFKAKTPHGSTISYKGVCKEEYEKLIKILEATNCVIDRKNP